jgi:hypothetical protein
MGSCIQSIYSWVKLLARGYWDSAKEADSTKIESALRMFWRAISQGVKVDYVLMDSWFTCEVFFKEAKQLLGLGRCQSNDFDAQVADTTITMIQHILLTLKYRFEHYETKGALFNQVREGIIQSRLDKRLWGLFVELIRLIEVLFDGIDEMELWERILNDEKAYEMITKLLPQVPEMQKAA